MAGIRAAFSRLGRAPAPLALDECFKSYLEDLALRARARTMAAARLACRRFLAALGDIAAAAVQPKLVLAWRHTRSEQGAANKTINTELGYVQSALALAVRNGQLEAHPLASMRSLSIAARHRRRQPRALSLHELLQVLAAAGELDAEAQRDGRSGGFPREPLIRTLAQTGMRWGEAITLTWADFDDEALVLVVKAEDSKTGVGRALPIDEDLAARISALRPLTAKILGKFPEPGTPIFRAPGGGPIAPT